MNFLFCSISLDGILVEYEKMNFNNFKYVLCNYTFPCSVLFSNEYNGVCHLIIQDNTTVMMTVNKEENVIRVSFDDRQEKYINYEDAVDSEKVHRFFDWVF